VLLSSAQWDYWSDSTRTDLHRYNTDGTLESVLSPSHPVTLLALQKDGRILVAPLRRLHLDGRVDETFKAIQEPGSQIQTLVIQPDGKMVVAGSFNTLGGEPHMNIGRLNEDGTIDPTFTAAVS